MIWRISFVAVLIGSLLVACSDRERFNCPPTKNKALRTLTTEVPATAAPQYGTGGKCV